jgi:hypothetical protein
MVVVALGAGLAAYLPFTETPSVRPMDAPATVFSAERAMTELDQVASPHPADGLTGAPAVDRGHPVAGTGRGAGSAAALS